MPTVSYGITNTADDVADFTASGSGVVGTEVLNGSAYAGGGIYSEIAVAGFRFLGVAPAASENIDSATLTLRQRFSPDGTHQGWLHVVLIGNAPAWSTTRPGLAVKSTARVKIVTGATQAYDVTALLQEVMPLRASGDALAFVGSSENADGSASWQDYSFNPAQAAQLSITYSAGGGPAGITADFNKTLGALSVTSTGTVVSNRTANLAATLGSFALSAAATSPISANFNKSLDALALTSNASVSLSAAAFLTLDPATLQADAETFFAEITAELNASLSELIFEAAANAIVSADAELPLGATVLSASASSVDQVEAEANIDLGALTLQSSGAVSLNVHAEFTFGDLTTTASAEAPIAAVMVAELAPLTVSASAGAINQIVANANLDFGAATVEASGAVTVSALATLNLSALMASADASTLVQGGLIAQLASIELASQLTADIMAELSVQLSALTLTAIAINGELPKVLAERRAILTGENRTAKLSRSKRRAVLIKTSRKAK